MTKKPTLLSELGPRDDAERITARLRHNLEVDENGLEQALRGSLILADRTGGVSASAHKLLGLILKGDIDKTEHWGDRGTDAKQHVDRSIYDLRMPDASISLSDGISLSVLVAALEEGVRRGTVLDLKSETKGVIAFLTNNIAKIYESIGGQRNRARRQIRDVAAEAANLEKEDRQFALLDMDRTELLTACDEAMTFFREQIATGAFAEAERARLEATAAQFREEIAAAKAEVARIEAAEGKAGIEKELLAMTTPPERTRAKFVADIKGLGNVSPEIGKLAADCSLSPAQTRALMHLCKTAGNVTMGGGGTKPLYPAIIEQITGDMDDAYGGGGKYPEYLMHSDALKPTDDWGRPARAPFGPYQQGVHRKFSVSEAKTALQKAYKSLAATLLANMPTPKAPPAPAPAPKRALRGGMGGALSFGPAEKAPVLTGWDARKAQLINTLLILLNEEPYGERKDYLEVVAAIEGRAQPLREKLWAIGDKTRAVEASVRMSTKQSFLDYELPAKYAALTKLTQEAAAAAPAVEQSYAEVKAFLDPAQTERPAGLYTMKCLLIASDQAKKNAGYPPLGENMRAFESFRTSGQHPVYAFTRHGDSRHDKLHYHPRHMPFLSVMAQYFHAKNGGERNVLAS